MVLTFCEIGGKAEADGYTFVKEHIGDVKPALYADKVNFFRSKEGRAACSKGGSTTVERHGGYANCHTSELQRLPASRLIPR